MPQFKIKITGASPSIQNILQINHIDKNISNLICILNTNKGKEGIYYEKILLVDLKNNIVKIAKYLYDKNKPIEGISLLIKSGNKYIYVKIESYLTDINSIYKALFDIQDIKYIKYNDDKKYENIANTTKEVSTKKNQKTIKKIEPNDLILTTLTGAIVIVFLFISANLMYIILLDITIRYLPFSLLYDDNFKRNYLREQVEYDHKIELERKEKERKKRIEEKIRRCDKNDSFEIGCDLYYDLYDEK